MSQDTPPLLSPEETSGDLLCKVGESEEPANDEAKNKANEEENHVNFNAFKRLGAS